VGAIAMGLQMILKTFNVCNVNVSILYDLFDDVIAVNWFRGLTKIVYLPNDPSVYRTINVPIIAIIIVTMTVTPNPTFPLPSLVAVAVFVAPAALEVPLAACSLVSSVVALKQGISVLKALLSTKFTSAH
jgi:hypothetical protein